jgi:hypothetical protein
MHSSSTELSQLLTTTNSNDLCPFITPRHGQRRNHRLSTVEKACLLICCLAMEVLFLRAYASAGICLPSRCLAMGLYVTLLLLVVVVVVVVVVIVVVVYKLGLYKECENATITIITPK